MATETDLPSATVERGNVRIPWNIEPHLKEEHVATEVADGVYRLCSNTVNMYLLEDEDGLTLVDAGLPYQKELLQSGLKRIGAEISDIEAVILTHTDEDHIGLAEPLRKEGIPVWVPEHGYEAALNGGNELSNAFMLSLWRPAYVRFILTLLDGNLNNASEGVEPIAEAHTYTDGQVLDVPGRPEVIHTPGHRKEHCSFWMKDRRVLFAGDALITMDILSGKATKPEPVRGGNRINFDKGLQMDSARKLAKLGQVTLLPGHGDVWEGDLGKLYAPAE